MTLPGNATVVPRILPERVALVPSIALFTQTLKPSDKGETARNLQRFLNQHGFIVAEAGVGSPGQESDYYGPLTQKAVARYQEAYGAYVLAPTGASDGSGIFGQYSLAYANQLLQRRFVNLFPVGGNPAVQGGGQVASVAGSQATIEAYASLLASIKQQAEKIQSLLSSLAR